MGEHWVFPGLGWAGRVIGVNELAPRAGSWRTLEAGQRSTELDSEEIRFQSHDPFTLGR